LETVSVDRATNRFIFILGSWKVIGLSAKGHVGGLPD